MPGANKPIDLWSTEARFAVIVETATLSEAELSEYRRRKGLYPGQIAQWKQAFLQTLQVDNQQFQQFEFNSVFLVVHPQKSWPCCACVSCWGCRILTTWTIH